MSIDQLSPRHSRPTSNTKLVSYDEYIDKQVESTRRLVKVVDLATSLVLLAAGVLAFLLTVAVVEHWIVRGGFPSSVRTVLFVLLAGGVGYFFYRRIWPLTVRTINPVYAAHAIEEAAAAGPSLKNSLINLLLFRQRRGEISDAVYQTLEEQAAQRLSRVPVDAAVDRSSLIRFGYVLLAVVALGSVYKLVSPKDPLVSAQRVLMPWADIVPASRVSIREVEPGSVTVPRGDYVNASAEVRGIGENDPVLLRYTTADGRAVDKPIPMKLSKDGLRFEGRLPEGGDESENTGVAESLRYRIEAGDARSLDYALTVVEAPSILVERVEYDFPEYTGYVDRQVEGMGDIRAIEGTRVTIHARANGVIRQAHIDFDADGRRDLEMATNRAQGQASFVLGLREDRATPEHASYVLRFTNRDGRSNRDPVKYAIHVEPDIGPEARILMPQEKELQIRLDETVTVEWEARDADFALSEVRLQGEVAGRAVMDEHLFAGRQSGRVTGRFQLTPSEHDLRAGDEMQYWVVAGDNRTPQSNTVATERKVLRIMSPDPARQPPPDRIAQRDPSPRQQDQPRQEKGDQSEQGDPQQGNEGQGRQQGEPQTGGRGAEGQRDGQPQPQSEAPREQAEQPENRDAERSTDANERQGEGEKGQTEQDGRDQRGEQRDGKGDQGSPANGQVRPGERDPNDKQTGAGAAGGEPSGSQPAGTRQPNEPGAGSAEGDRGARPMPGERQGGEGQPEPSAEQPPISSEGDNDAEAFDRIRRHLARDGELPEGDAAASDESNNGGKRDAGQDAESGQGDKETGRQGGGKANEPVAPKSAQGAISKDADDADGKPKGENDAQVGKKSPGPESDERQPAGPDKSGEGNPGAGEEQDPQGAPNSEPGMKPGEKRPDSPTAGETSDRTEPPAGGRGKKESDSQGEQGGDRSGGGEEGGGQDAPREGAGNAGQNQVADEGAGESTEPGGDAASSKAGDDAVAGEPTGKSGEQPGESANDRREGEGKAPGGDTKGAQPQAGGGEKSGQGDKETGRPGDAGTDGKDGADRSQAEKSGASQQRGTPTGDGGEMGTADGRPPTVDGSAPDGDEANLEYARKQTDLVLEKLAEQLNRKRVDDALLEELGWSEEELRRFVERWQSRKVAAEREDSSGPAAQRELDEALRSLGLRPGPLQQGPASKDTLRDLREGYRGTVPLEYKERLRAYNEGVSRARRDGE